MDLIELNRSFVPIDKDEEPSLDLGSLWGLDSADRLDWPALLGHRRVVLLAEAASGKTGEFRHRADVLARQGEAAFFVRVEDLADDGFEGALEPDAVERYLRWRDSRTSEEGWFFLDSVDEARLGHRNDFPRALRRVARELGDSLERARVYLSCRVSDWTGGRDAAMVERLLPVWEQPAPPVAEDDDARLLDPIFAPRNETEGGTSEGVDPARKSGGLLIVRLAPLDGGQRRSLAAAAGVVRPDDFIEAIERDGLDTLAERPGDLIDLAHYWRERGRFGSLGEMTGYAVERKLTERDKYRPDNGVLSDQEVRRGAERLAAALTLAKSFTLRAPGQEPDPILAAGALDPDALLPEWHDAKRGALLRRGVFAPATYGRIRFHHRGTQEYLTAQWLDRLLAAGCLRDAVWQLLFSERYGVETLVPSLHATAAWLALDRSDIRDEVIRREPLVLVQHGDPGSLPLAVKERLLQVYAERHRAGEVGSDSIDRRALWLFAVPELASAIRRCWHVNERQDFCLDLLRMVREGPIRECADLARQAVLDETADDYLRRVALEALDACGDEDGLEAAARWLMGAGERAGARLAVRFSEVLFPRYITVDQLLHLIDLFPDSETARDGFGFSIEGLWQACRDAELKERLVSGVAELCLVPPFASDYRRASVRHYQLARRLQPLGRAVVSSLETSQPSDGTVRLLMAIERGDDGYGWNTEGSPPLGTLVTANPRLQRALFWADVSDARKWAEPDEANLTRWWQINTGLHALWRFGPADLDWLFADLESHHLEDDRRIALNAIVDILTVAGTLHSESPRLRALTAGSMPLEDDLRGYLTPPVESDEARRFRSKRLAWKQEWEERERKNKASWVAFRDELMAAPAVLSDSARLAKWSKGASRLHDLTSWLQHRTRAGEAEAASQWRLLEEGFGRAVAEAYRDGMKALWRITSPERPRPGHHRRLERGPV